MKKTIKVLLTVFMALNLAAALNAQTRLTPPNNPNAAAGPGQAEIVINAENSDKDIAVWVNGVIAAHLSPRSWEKIIVNNGVNLVEAAETTLTRNGLWNIGTKRRININSDSNIVTVGLSIRYGSLLNLTMQQTVAVGGVQSTPSDQPSSAQPSTQSSVAQPPRPAVNSGDIYNAIKEGAKILEEDIPSGSTLAILGIASNEWASEVIEELTYLMVSARKFTVVDRLSLNAIMEERQFQYSGEVDDKSAVDIGKMLGASIVITGSVTESGYTRRLSLKALDVLTARIVAMARESF